ncbi:methyl-accepting chemotaxis protein [Novosphingobium lentum]|uniref:methyl-accepting chemotaxis protein n=1 Tax=Novosphingobium lentum TaxID=145287 RepID=UPI0008305CE6|nr:methyl-accepting chemotaxis protein [Novosphingobium lentum]
MEDILQLRRKGMIALVGLAWLFLAIIGIGAGWAPGGFLPVGLALAVTATPTLLALTQRAGPGARMAMGWSMPLYPAILLLQWSGSDWELDLHMIFFATIATLAVLADWRPVVVAAAVTAVHHLITNFVAPALVFPDGANFERVVLHAIVVITETGALVMLTVRLERLVLGQAAARTERARVEALAIEERARRDAEQHNVIKALGGRLKALADGGLSQTIEQAFPAGYEALREHFNSATGDLNQTIRAVITSAEQMNCGASEIRSASDDLARRTENQAASLEKTLTALEKVSTGIRDTAERATNVNQSIAVTHGEALAGGAVVARAVEAMNQIEQSAGEIGQITSIIDSISFQTNLLALNAGVEAARAGDAGKGFAVVANEVRALAQRSADAAQTIRTLITTSGQQVSEGVALVGETGKVLNGIVEQVTGIGDSIALIASGADDQAQELRRVNGAMGDIDQLTQQNAAMAEQSSAATRNLSHEATLLASLVARFETTGDDRAEPTARSSRGMRQAA